MSGTFKAFIVDKKEEGFTATFKDLTEADLPPGEVLVKVAYSSVNYKDGLASIPEGKIVRNYPFVPGIDLSGVVAESSDYKPEHLLDLIVHEAPFTELPQDRNSDV